MTPSSPRRGQVQPVLAVALGVVAIAGLVVALGSRPATPSSAGASDRPSTAPAASPAATQAPGPTVDPTAAPPAGSISFELENASGHDVTLQVHDQTGTLAGAESGPAVDGMSVRWHDARVRTVGPRTILVTWAGLPQDEAVDLGVAILDGRLLVTIVQAGPVPDSDAMGEDRSVALTFDGALLAGDVSVEVLDRAVD